MASADQKKPLSDRQHRCLPTRTNDARTLTRAMSAIGQMARAGLVEQYNDSLDKEIPTLLSMAHRSDTCRPR